MKNAVDFKKMAETKWAPAEFEGNLYYPIVDVEYDPDQDIFMAMSISPDKTDPDTGDYIVFMAKWKPADEWDREDFDWTAATDWNHAYDIWECDYQTTKSLNAERWLKDLPTLN